jgi:hypothetical protein
MKTPLDQLKAACDSRIANSKREVLSQLDHLQRTIDEIRRSINEDKGWAPTFNTSSVLDLARELGKLAEEHRQKDEIHSIEGWTA